jgi:hypothetical protein
MIVAARAVVPGLTQIALVGDAWNDQAAFGHWMDEIPQIGGNLLSQPDSLGGISVAVLDRHDYHPGTGALDHGPVL